LLRNSQAPQAEPSNELSFEDFFCFLESGKATRERTSITEQPPRAATTSSHHRAAITEQPPLSSQLTELELASSNAT